MHKSTLKFFLNEKELKIGVIGLGYVGLPLAVELGKKYTTIGFDINKKRIEELNQGIDKILEVSINEIKAADKLTFSFDTNHIDNCNIYIITVPTPVDKYNVPDMSPLDSGSRIVGNVLNIGDVVIYESTVYPGATEEFCVPILEHESGLKYNTDFFCGYSPERINPGDKKHSLTSIVKVTSGSNKKIANFIDKLYTSIIPAGTHKASSIAVAEAAKVIENIQRDVNIALINELSIIFNKLNLDTYEVLEAAGTKWNFLSFRPGLVGGHCIGVDPYYLTHKAKEIDYHPEMILAGRRVNDSMSKYISDCAISEMVNAGINPINAKVGVFGLTFKENCPDLRNTKVPDLINHLLYFGCDINVTDSYADQKEAKNIYNLKLAEKNSINKCDVIIMAVAHEDYKKMNINEWKKLFNKNGVFIDVKGIFNKEFFSGTNIVYWRL